MKFMTRVRRFWRHAILRRPLRRNFIGGERRPPPRYTGEGSFTRGAIIRVLADGKPRTRRMIAEQLDERMAHDQPRTAEVVHRLEGHLRRLLAMKAGLGVEPFAQADAGEGQ